MRFTRSESMPILQREHGAQSPEQTTQFSFEEPLLTSMQLQTTPKFENLGFFMWLKQMQISLSKLVLVLLVCLCGCNARHDTVNLASSDNNVTEEVDSENAAPEIKPGFYRDGVEYERVATMLAASDASVSLDYHSGIEWYDKKSKTRSTLDDINDVKSLLASIENKHLVTISTGKAAWEKCDEYIAKVAGFAEELGFDMTIVTDNNGQGLVVSKVIQHEH